ncbi:MAG: flagellar biosynthetic protein FliO [Rhizomicrobium sp.]
MDLIDFARYIGALLLVLGLVGAAGLAARRFGVSGLNGLVKPSAARRLAVVETLGLGPRQRLLIIRRDGVEHLVLSGPEGTTVIETGIPAAPLPITAALLAPEASS